MLVKETSGTRHLLSIKQGLADPRRLCSTLVFSSVLSYFSSENGQPGVHIAVHTQVQVLLQVTLVTQHSAVLIVFGSAPLVPTAFTCTSKSNMSLFIIRFPQFLIVFDE